LKRGEPFCLRRVAAASQLKKTQKPPEMSRTKDQQARKGLLPRQELWRNLQRKKPQGRGETTPEKCSREEKTRKSKIPVGRNEKTNRLLKAKFYRGGKWRKGQKRNLLRGFTVINKLKSSPVRE